MDQRRCCPFSVTYHLSCRVKSKGSSWSSKSSRECLDMKGQSCLWKDNKRESKQRLNQEIILESATVDTSPFLKRLKSSLLHWNSVLGFAVKNTGKPLADSSGVLFLMLLLFFRAKQHSLCLLTGYQFFPMLKASEKFGFVRKECELSCWSR